MDDIPAVSQDRVLSADMLERMAGWECRIVTWIGKLKLSGCVFPYLPPPDGDLRRRRNPCMAQERKWAPDPHVIAGHLSRIGLSVVDRDDGPDRFYSFIVCGGKHT